MTAWWNRNVEDRLDTFSEWIKDYNQSTKVYCRSYVASKGYKSIIDCGCGLATEYFGYINDNYEIDYTGLDSCKYLVDMNVEKNIKMIFAELECDFLIKDNTYDCVYCREVIEHLSYYEKAINEFIRIGKKEVIIVWFLKPGTYPLSGDELPESLKMKELPAPGEDQINYWAEEDLYHNVYSINKLENFILSNSKVDSIEWKDFGGKESILHIKLREA